MWPDCQNIIDVSHPSGGFARAGHEKLFFKVSDDDGGKAGRELSAHCNATGLPEVSAVESEDVVGQDKFQQVEEKNKPGVAAESTCEGADS